MMRTAIVEALTAMEDLTLSIPAANIAKLLALVQSSPALTPIEIQRKAADCVNLDDESLALSLLAFHYQQRQTENGLTNPAFNASAVLLTQIDIPKNQELALRFLAYHLKNVKPDDPSAWAIFHTCFGRTIPDASISTLNDLINHYTSSATPSTTITRALSRALHLHSILTSSGDPQVTADKKYVETVFDDLSERFEEHLVGCLGYKVPVELRDLVLKSAEGEELRGMKMIDLGCGTGLVGREFFTILNPLSATSVGAPPPPTTKHEDIIMDADVKELKNKIKRLKESNDEMRSFDPSGEDPDMTSAIAENMTIIESRSDEVVSMEIKLGRMKGKGFWCGGCDLSGRMCELSRSRRFEGSSGDDINAIFPRIYDEVKQLDCAEYMQLQDDDSILLVVAADTLIYVGKIEELFRATAKAMKNRGLLAFSIEVLADEGATFKLLDSGRYGHSIQYVETCSKECGFVVVAMQETVLRTEGVEKINGMNFICRYVGGGGGMML